MSGGSNEYTASYLEGQVGESGFTLEELNKVEYQLYLEKYPENSPELQYSARILGDATGEMGPFYKYYDDATGERRHNSWYSDNASFVDNDNPWFSRSTNSNRGYLAGQFAFSRDLGNENGTIGSRLVLATN